ncbi:glucose-1-phosphate thymidylyltransferase [Labilibaculum sp. A4]|uniref:GlmU family protein n=1 Tax=Labilibaculum euxinus TaxID=2686357 RepID=UPI000F6170FC|nr:GlmU family protein [Labilibaculum euxinus]MDQ1769849.1 GlmU family protein [Labilibaculum euxinus]MWN76406.1 glucose-1-phosphate thymidylyltransferase [Labilibaculum euxinus]
MNYILFDDGTWNDLRPLTFTRPVSEIRVGILSIREKWEKYLTASLSHFTQDYLSVKYPIFVQEQNVLINGSVLPDERLKDAILNLKVGEYLAKDGVILAANFLTADLELVNKEGIEAKVKVAYKQAVDRIAMPYDIFGSNDKALRADFELLTKGRQSQKISDTVNVLGKENIFLEEGAKVEFACLNAVDGPIYIGKDAVIMEGCLVRGPLAMCEHAELKMGAKVYGATTLGPYCKCGGELNNVVLFGYSSKAHDGFLGNAVLGEWCNIGADTNNSNLKNNYSEVKLWNYSSESFEKTGLQFCGTIMGDHSKCGINTMLNTGTVIGVSANVFGAGFPRNFIPSFAMGGNHGFKEYRLKATFEVADLVMRRRGLEFNEVEKNILTNVFEMTKEYRKSF